MDVRRGMMAGAALVFIAFLLLGRSGAFSTTTEVPMEEAAVPAKSPFANLDEYEFAFHGMPIDPPESVGDFALVDQRGDSFQLSDQRGNLVVLFFGYTTCPDVCPATLVNYRQVRQSLGPDARRVTFVFVTVDPERDTPEQLANYIERFDSSIYGLTGPMEHLESVWDAFGIHVEKVQMPESPVGYSVDHTALTYVIDGGGQLVGLYPFGIPPEYVVQDLKRLLEQAHGTQPDRV